MYKNKKNLFEETKSTAWSFTLVSIIGLVLIVLMYCDVLPFRLQPYMKIIFSIVMGVMFLIFLAIGIRSFLSLGKIKNAAASQESKQNDIKTYFMEHLKERILAYTPAEGADIDSADLYFARTGRMKLWLHEQFPNVTEDELDVLVEDIYNELF